MFAWRVTGVVAWVLAAAAVGRAETYPLAEVAKAGDCFRVRLDMSLKGQMRVHKDDKVVPLTLETVGSHDFPERVLSVGGSGLPDKVVRAYETAKATIRVGGETSERVLRGDRRLIVAQRAKDQLVVYCPAGGLRRPELELTGEHFDTLSVAGLLPGKAVAVGDTWKVANPVAQALCSFEGLTEQDLAGKLEKVEGDVATFSVKGSASGIDLGALVKVKVEATGTFELAAKRLTGLEWKQDDERGQGPVSPATTVQTTTTLRRQPVEQPAALSDVATASVPAGTAAPANTLLNVECPDPKGRFDLLHAREWQLVAQTEQRTVLRLMDRGDFVAQATITPWTAAGKGKHLTPDEFRAAMNNAPGWEPERELQSGEVPTEGEGRWTYRVSAQGRLEGVAVLQNFYLVAAPGGEQVVVAVTLAPKQADKLGARDLALIGSLEVPAAPGK